MSFIIGLLSAVLLLDCCLLILLVLIQLPKKEAGAGIAFGAGTADALFGAGSGNALTKITKYAATVFLGLALALTIMQANRLRDSKTGVGEALKKAGAAAVVPAQPPAAVPAATPAPASNAPAPAAPQK